MLSAYSSPTAVVPSSASPSGPKHAKPHTAPSSSVATRIGDTSCILPQDTYSNLEAITAASASITDPDLQVLSLIHI